MRGEIKLKIRREGDGGKEGGMKKKGRKLC